MTQRTVATKPRVEIDPNFERQIQAIQQDALLAASPTEPQWFRPAVAEGDRPSYFDFQGVGSLFERDTTNEAMAEAVSDAKEPGVAGDEAAGSTQIDYLGMMERAYRSRHHATTPRVTAMSIARLKGHANPIGVLSRGPLEQARVLVAMARGQTSGTEQS